MKGFARLTWTLLFVSVPPFSDNPTGYSSHVIIGDDHGKTWRIGGVIRPEHDRNRLLLRPF